MAIKNLLNLGKVVKKTVEANKKQPNWTERLAKSLNKAGGHQIGEAVRGNPLYKVAKKTVDDEKLEAGLALLLAEKARVEAGEGEQGDAARADLLNRYEMGRQAKIDQLGSSQLRPSAPELSDAKRDEMRKLAGIKVDRTDEMRAMLEESSQPPKPRPLSEVMGEQKGFLQKFGENLAAAPGQMLGSMADVLSGKAAEKISEAEKRYAADVKSGKEAALFPESAENWWANAALQGTKELTRAGISGVGGVVKGAGGLANLVTQSVAELPFMSLPENLRPKLSGEGFMLGNPLLGLGESIQTLGTGISGVPQDSISGELGEFAGEMLAARKPSRAALSAFTKMIKSTEKGEAALGSLIRGRKILEGSATAKQGGVVMNRIEQAANFFPKFLRNRLRDSLTGAADTVLYTGVTEGRKPTTAELAAGTLVNNVMGIFGGVLVKKGGEAYRKAIKMFSGKEENVETLARKTEEAMQEGFFKGKNPEKYLELADEKIASYSQEVNKALKESNKSFGKEFFDNVKSKIEEVYKHSPEKAKLLDKALDAYTGKKYVDDIKLLSKKINNATQTIDEYKQSLAALFAKPAAKRSVGQVNKITSSIRNEELALQRLQEKRDQAVEIVKKTAKGELDLFDLVKAKQLAADWNKQIVSGRAGASAKDAASGEIWMILRDESEKYLNKVLPHLKDVNSRLNVAFRIKDAVSPYIKEADLVMKRSPALAEGMYRTGQFLESPFAKQLGRGTVFRTDDVVEGAKGLVDLFQQ